MAGKIHIGTSGWSYRHWRGTFYPDDLKVKDEFGYYLGKFGTVEINNTFYHLPKSETFEKWHDTVPDGFVYAIKASRFITHMKKLLDPEKSTVELFDRVALLREKLGVILFQLPPFLKSDAKRLETFLEALPKHWRYTFEFRNDTWYDEGIYGLLRKHNCAFCIYELAGHMSPGQITADFVYLRLHGPGGKYQGSYTDGSLKKWAETCRGWLRDKDVFVYFDNDENGYAAFNAQRLREFI